MTGSLCAWGGRPRRRRCFHFLIVAVAFFTNGCATSPTAAANRPSTPSCWSYPLSESLCCPGSDEHDPLREGSRSVAAPELRGAATGDQELDARRSNCFDGSIHTSVEHCCRKRDSRGLESTTTSTSSTSTSTSSTSSPHEGDAESGERTHFYPSWFNRGAFPALVRIVGKANAPVLSESPEVFALLKKQLWEAQFPRLFDLLTQDEDEQRAAPGNQLGEVLQGTMAAFFPQVFDELGEAVVAHRSEPRMFSPLEYSYWMGDQKQNRNTVSALFRYSHLQKCNEHFGWGTVEVKFRLLDFFRETLAIAEAELQPAVVTSHDDERRDNDTRAPILLNAEDQQGLLDAEDVDVTHVVCLPVGELMRGGDPSVDQEQHGFFAMLRLYLLPLWLKWQEKVLQQRLLDYVLRAADRVRVKLRILRRGNKDKGRGKGSASGIGGGAPAPLVEDVVDGFVEDQLLRRLTQQEEEAEQDQELLRGAELLQRLENFAELIRVEGNRGSYAFSLFLQGGVLPASASGQVEDYKRRTPLNYFEVRSLRLTSAQAFELYQAALTEQHDRQSKTPSTAANEKEEVEAPDDLSVAVCISGGTRGFVVPEVHNSIRSSLLSLKARRVRIFYQLDTAVGATKLGVGDRAIGSSAPTSSREEEDLDHEHDDDQEQHIALVRKAVEAIERGNSTSARPSSSNTTIIRTVHPVEVLSSASWTRSAFFGISPEEKRNCLSDQITCPIMGVQREACRTRIREHEERRKMRFDWVLFTRPDLYLRDLGRLARFDPKYLHTPSSYKWGCVSCKLALVPARSLLDVYVDSYRRQGDRNRAFACFGNKQGGGSSSGGQVGLPFAGKRGTDCGCTLWRALRTCSVTNADQDSDVEPAPVNAAEDTTDVSWQGLYLREGRRTPSAAAAKTENKPEKPLSSASKGAASALQTRREDAKVCGNPESRVEVPAYETSWRREQMKIARRTVLEPPVLMPPEQAMAATVTRHGLWRPDYSQHMAWF